MAMREPCSIYQFHDVLCDAERQMHIDGKLDPITCARITIFGRRFSMVLSVACEVFRCQPEHLPGVITRIKMEVEQMNEIRAAISAWERTRWFRQGVYDRMEKERRRKEAMLDRAGVVLRSVG